MATEQKTIEFRPNPPMFFRVLCAVLVLALSLWLGLKARNAAREHKFIGVPIERNVITVSGEGRVIALPDIATIDLGMTVERPTVGAAQKENTETMNKLIAKLKEFGVDEKDIQTTNYSVYPAYDYLNGRQRLRGYTVTQNVRVKVRNLDRVGDIIGAAGELGANQIGGITFTIDEPEELKQQARIKALENAKQKAEALAEVVGVKLRRVVSFEESGGEPPPVYPYERAFGLGGDAAVPAPAIEAGSTEIIITAYVTYEIE